MTHLLTRTSLVAQPVFTKYPDCKYSNTTLVGFGTLVCLNRQVSATRGWNISLLHKWERLCFFIRPLRALLEHLAVGDVAQRVTDVPEYKASEVKMGLPKVFIKRLTSLLHHPPHIYGHLGTGALFQKRVLATHARQLAKKRITFLVKVSLAPRPHNTLPYHTISLIIDQPHHNMPYPVFTCTWEQGVF